MKDYIILFKNHSEYEAYINGDDKILPNVSLCGEEDEMHYEPKPIDYSKKYLTFVAKEGGTFTFTPSNSLADNNVISYSTDNGINWVDGNSVTVNKGDKVMWKGTMTPATSQGIGNFSSTAEFDVEGNAMSLLFGDDFKGQTSLTGKDYVFSQLFYQNTKIINAEKLLLPATTLADYCYYNMFDGCTKLVIAPKLPATTLTLACYVGMFYGCTSLTTAPELPAETLVSYCYQYMFQDCTSLTTAPELPATTLVQHCYYRMFYNCTSLNYIKAMFTTTPGTDYTSNWVNGVASSGTFVKNMNATWTNTFGVNGIPTGWTVESDSFGGDDYGEIDSQ